MVITLDNCTDNYLNYAIERRGLHNRIHLKVVLEGQPRRFIYRFLRGKWCFSVHFISSGDEALVLLGKLHKHLNKFVVWYLTRLLMCGGYQIDISSFWKSAIICPILLFLKDLQNFLKTEKYRLYTCVHIYIYMHIYLYTHTYLLWVCAAMLLSLASCSARPQMEEIESPNLITLSLYQQAVLHGYSKLNILAY